MKVLDVIHTYNNTLIWAGCFSGIMAALYVALLIYLWVDMPGAFRIIYCIMFCVTITLTCWCICTGTSPNFNPVQYKVSLDDTYTAKELLSEYKVIKRDGEAYIVEELKDWEKA